MTTRRRDGRWVPPTSTTPEDVHVLVVRAWLEARADAPLRVRLVEAGTVPPETFAVAASPREAGRALEAWLEKVVGSVAGDSARSSTDGDATGTPR